MHTEAVFDNIANRIEKEIAQAKSSVIIAVAWFTNQNLFDAILKKAKNGCEVSLMITNDKINDNSLIDFEQLNINTSKVYKIWNAENKLMHNKFCVIDFSTVITGSYNWSYKAESNHENIVINYGDLTLAEQFANEFNHIKSIYFPDVSKEGFQQALPIDKIIKRLEILKNVIILEDFEDVSHTVQKLKKFDNDNTVQRIIDLTGKELYGEVVELIQQFISQYQQLVLWDDAEIGGLKLEIKILENQINAFENEKIDLEKTISDFQNRHTKELGKIILEILKLRKLKYKDDEEKAQEAENDYKQYQKQYEVEIEKEVFELNEEEKLELKKQYKSASILCHPDKFMNEPQEIQKQAEELFKELNEANSNNDLKRVKQILDNLQKGILSTESTGKLTDKQKLKLTVQRLKQKLEKLTTAIKSIKEDNVYIKICEIPDWDVYFTENKDLLQKELEDLKNG